jgi:hypothetical protein
MSTVSAGGIGTAALWNSQVRDTGTFFLGTPHVVLRQSVAQSLTSSTFTAVTWDVEDRDNDAMHSTVTNTSRMTAVTAGWYEFMGLMAYAGNTSGVRNGRWHINGTAIPGTEGGVPATFATGSGFVMPCSTAFMSVGDYLEMVVWQSSGGALNTSAAGMRCSVRWVAQ